MDQDLFLALYGGDSSGALTWTMMVFTAVGSGWTALLIVPFFAFSRLRVFAAALGGVMVTDFILVAVLKELLHRERPWMALHLSPFFQMPTNYSFPSGHATGCFSVAVFVAVLLARKGHTGRRAIIAGLLGFAFFVSLSRIYLGAHYPADVLAGALLGSALGYAGARFCLRAEGPATASTQ